MLKEYLPIAAVGALTGGFAGLIFEYEIQSYCTVLSRETCQYPPLSIPFAIVGSLASVSLAYLISKL